MRAAAVREDVENLILDAADRLLARYGYRKMTMDDLAQSALLLSAPAALPIIIRHDRNEALYVVSGDRRAAVCQVAGVGEGTLVAPRRVLTVARVGEGMGRSGAT